MSKLVDGAKAAVFWGSFIAVLAAIIALTVTAALVQNVSYIVKQPVKFVGEVLIMALFMSLPIIYIGYVRGAGSKATWTLFGSFAAHIIIIHVLLEISGLYDRVFSKGNGFGL